VPGGAANAPGLIITFTEATRRGILAERFWSKVNKAGPILVPALGQCWVWTAGTVTGGNGYGVFTMQRLDRRRQMRATHVAWFLRFGRWPTDCMLHRCDNPACVRWDHLCEGTRKDNARDRVAKGRPGGANGDAHGSAKLTDDVVRALRLRYGLGRISLAALALEYDLGHTAMWKAIAGVTWKMVTDPAPIRLGRGRRKRN